MNRFLVGSTAWRVIDGHALRQIGAPLVLVVFALALATAYAAAIVRTEGDPVLLLPIVAAIVVVAVLANPAIGLYALFASALLFEQHWITGLTPITQTRIYQNISTYTAVPLPFSTIDLIVLLTYAGLWLRRINGGAERLRVGALGAPVLAYAFVFLVGTVIGAARGGDWDLAIALTELRGPLMLMLAYLLATNLISDRRQLAVFLWLFVLVVGTKALQGILNYRESLELPYYLDAVTSHEDVVFFGVAVALMVVAAVCGLRTRLAYVLFAIQPVVLIAELLSARRVGLVALGVILIAVAVLVLATDLRRGVVLVALGMVGLLGYVALFWDSAGPVAEPIRALRSVFEPSALNSYDQSSDAWRAIENRNIAHTVRQLPLTGVGLGQQYLFQQEPSPLYGFANWRYVAHNAVLWLWLKAGPLGALALWFLVARTLLVGARIYVRFREPELRLAVALPIALVVSQIVFSSVDLGLTYSRTMIVLGASLGMIAFLATQDRRQLADAVTR